MKSWPQRWRRLFYDAESSEAVVHLLTITHPDLAAPIRLTTHPSGFTSRGAAFAYFPFEIVPPDDSPDGPGRASLRIGNVDRSILAALRSVATAPEVLYEAVLEDEPDFVGLAFSVVWRESSYDLLSIESTLEFDDLSGEAFPWPDFVPAYFRSFPQ